MAADDRGPEMAYIAIIFTAISLISLGLRLYTSGFILGRLFPADWVAIATGVNQAAFCSFVVLGVHHGLGKHVEEVSLDHRVQALRWKWAGMVSYVVGSTLIKFVATLLLLRLFKGQKWQRNSLIAIMVLVGLVQTGYLFIAIFQCTPIPFYWFRYTEDAPVSGQCLKPAMATIPTYISILLGVISDWYLAILPITLVWKIKMEKKAKISIVAVLAIGSMASLANVVRIPYAKQLLSDDDYLYNATDLSIWSLLECALGLTATSLAMLRPLFVRLRVFSTTHMRSIFQSKSRTGCANGTTEQSTARDKPNQPHSIAQYPQDDLKGAVFHSTTKSESRGSHKAQTPTALLSPSERDKISFDLSQDAPWSPLSPEARCQSREGGRSTPSWDSKGHWKLRAPPMGKLPPRKHATSQEGDWFELSPPPPLFARASHPHARNYSA